MTIGFFDRRRTRFNGLYGNKMVTNPIATMKDKFDYFAGEIGTGRPFDIKRKGGGYNPTDLNAEAAYFNGELFSYDDFGNYNYGAAARAFGFSLETALMGAGFNQTFQTQTPDFSNPRGYFDHSRDTEMIIKGYNNSYFYQY
jgi:hypothetical protein